MSVTFYFQPPALLPGRTCPRPTGTREGRRVGGGREPDKMNVYVFYRGEGWLVSVWREEDDDVGKENEGKKAKRPRGKQRRAVGVTPGCVFVSRL